MFERRIYTLNPRESLYVETVLDFWGKPGVYLSNERRREDEDNWHTIETLGVTGLTLQEANALGNALIEATHALGFED